MSRRALEIYRRALAAGGGRISEDGAVFAGMSELEWQARWFAGEFGREWKSADGAQIRIEDFGRWNREPGPDFVDARIRIDGREVRGAIELDADARDWERHGHATNPSFREAALHVFMHEPERRFFTRTCENREVAQLRLPASTGLSQAPSTPHGAPFETGQMLAILHAAARHRLDLKARALHRYAAVHGENEAWFAALAVTLGYKRNQTPFLLLAQRAGLRAAAEPKGEALLFGIAGFLESPEPPACDRLVRAYLRALWEHWWSLRAGCERLILPRTAWLTGGIRPANHPHRRVAALSRIAAGWQPIRKALAGSRRDELIASLESIEHPFWAARFNLRAGLLPRPQALLGAERIRDIVINIHHPLAVAKDDSAWGVFLAEKGAAPAAILRTSARRFLGAATDIGALLSSAVAQQGLLQLDRDYRAATDPREFVAALRRLPADSTLGDPPC